MNWYYIFYWLTVADGVKSIFDTSSNILTSFAIVSLVAYLLTMVEKKAFTCYEIHNEDSDKMKSINIWLKHFRSFFWISMIMAFITWIAWAAVPTKKDCLLIVAGGGAMNFLTTDSAAKELPHEAMNYVVTELRNMAVEANVDIGVSKQKNKILEEARNLTGAELIEKMKTDSTLAKIILEQ